MRSLGTAMSAMVLTLEIPAFAGTTAEARVALSWTAIS
jgi:hypothetical protein